MCWEVPDSLGHHHAPHSREHGTRRGLLIFAWSDLMASLSEPVPPPTPLRRCLTIHFQWGKTKFEMVANAASIRSFFWEPIGQEVIWLHCKATRVQDITSDGRGSATNYLIPAEYVTYTEPGPLFQITRTKPTRDLAVYPPNQPPPPNPVPLDELDRRIGELIDASIN